MALTDKKYEKFYRTDGSGDDKIKSDDLTMAEEVWDLDRANGMKDHINNPDFAPLIFQLQQIQDELDYLRSEISTNKDKAAFPGLGTSNSTAMAGDTTTITTAQANAITANTAKVSMVIGTGKGEAMSGQTNIPIVTVGTGKNIEVMFDNLKIGQKTTTIDLIVVDTSTKKQYTSTITLR